MFDLRFYSGITHTIVTKNYTVFVGLLKTFSIKVSEKPVFTTFWDLESDRLLTLVVMYTQAKQVLIDSFD